MAGAARYAILCAGGHASVVLDAIRAGDPAAEVALFDQMPQADGLLGCPVLEGQPWDHDFPPDVVRTHVANGRAAVRARLMAALTERGYASPPIVHPRGTVGAGVTLGQGCFVAAGAVINPRAQLGAGVIVNTNAVVEHDCEVGDFAHVSPGAVMAGGAALGARSQLGATAVIREGVAVGDDILLGAGAYAGADIDTPGAYVGQPARALGRG